MRKLLTFLILATGISLLSIGNRAFAQTTEEMPVTFFVSLGGSAGLDDEAAVKSASATFRAGIKTNLNQEGSWRLVTVYNALNKPILREETSGDYVKSLGLGAERLYKLKATTGFFANSYFVGRGLFDIEVNRSENDNNLGLGFGWLKKLSVDEAGQSNFSVEVSIDMIARDSEEDDLTGFLTLNFTPTQGG